MDASQTPPPPPPAPSILRTDVFAPGCLKEVYAEGVGATPAAGDEVTAHYTGRLLDGTVFDSTRGGLVSPALKPTE